MCWEYEHEYEGCWDHLVGKCDGRLPGEDETIRIAEDPESSLVVWLRENYGVYVRNKETFEQDLLRIFSEWHETGVIHPIQRQKRK